VRKKKKDFPIELILGILCICAFLVLLYCIWKPSIKFLQSNKKVVNTAQQGMSVSESVTETNSVSKETESETETEKKTTQGMRKITPQTEETESYMLGRLSDTSKKVSQTILLALEGKKVILNTKTQKEVYLTKLTAKDDLMEEKFSFTPDQYAIVDMNQDGKNEVIVSLTNGTDEWYYLLHENSGKIRGYFFDYRAMEAVGTDGTYLGSSGARSNEYLSLEFEGDKIIEKIIAKEEENEYEVSQKKASESQFEKYVKTLGTVSSPAEWSGYSLEQIQKISISK